MGSAWRSVPAALVIIIVIAIFLVIIIIIITACEIVADIGSRALAAGRDGGWHQWQQQ